ncbi:hypothetical protein [Bifidobacterium sp. ESL0732]|uniref:hypothetical protein n=1 Tax=Bifidobacterium sp. ESL0732 TaxID=2983222 RepID=UPI0023F839A7|nr:hypothetical protein [Bifidobacterium sp. ESL0732]WEV64477.1 hypothetical protein OZX70_02520 [Bifidobacterium sp. ESL0732]
MRLDRAKGKDTQPLGIGQISQYKEEMSFEMNPDNIDITTISTDREQYINIPPLVSITFTARLRGCRSGEDKRQRIVDDLIDEQLIAFNVQLTERLEVAFQGMIAISRPQHVCIQRLQSVQRTVQFRYVIMLAFKPTHDTQKRGFIGYVKEHQTWSMISSISFVIST